MWRRISSLSQENIGVTPRQDTGATTLQKTQDTTILHGRFRVRGKGEKYNVSGEARLPMEPDLGKSPGQGSMEAITRDHVTVTRIQNARTLRAARSLVLIVGCISLLVFIAGNLAVYDTLHDSYPAEGLARIGLSPTFYIAFQVGTRVLFGLISFSVAALIFWRRSDDRMGLLMAVFLTTFGAAFAQVSGSWVAWDNRSLIYWAATAIAWIGWAMICGILTVFPDGKVPFRWLHAPIMMQVLVSTIWNFGDGTPISAENWPPLLIGGVVIFEVVSGVYAARWKYLHTLSPSQRQQTKWPIIGIVLATTIYGTTFLTPLIFPQAQTDSAAAVLDGLYSSSAGFALILIPLTLTFAILRYRLWDIDFFINLSLVYSAATAAIVALFFGVSVILQSVLGSQQLGIALVVSGAIAALAFNPARRQAQHWVDRLIYRLNFDLNEIAAAQITLKFKHPGALTGRRLGIYDVLGVLGKGGMGEVYQGQCGGKQVALKVLPEDLARQTGLLRRFEREAEALAKLKHPNIVKILDSGVSEGISYIALEYIEGQDLSAYLRKHKRLDIDTARRLIRDCAAALDYAHQHGYVHRDIKPSNILLRMGADDTPLGAILSDFGVAKMEDAPSDLTNTGAIGTIDYMAPEQIMIAKAVDKRADIYALGIVLYEMITGERPFRGHSGQVLFGHLHQPPPDPRKIVDTIPSPVACAIMQAMAKEPDDRYGSAGAFAGALG
jgi:predicted Ser/Thr protein kinase